VRRVLEETAAAVPWRLADKPPGVTLWEFGSSSVDWRVVVWIHDPWLRGSYAGMLREAIWEAFLENQIVIAFPQVDVHLDPDVQGALQALPEALGHRRAKATEATA
jgi:small-conductance mechanosensitive channel